MAILNKLGSIARNVSGRTGNMLEVSKLNALIRSSEDDIEELKQQLRQQRAEGAPPGRAGGHLRKLRETAAHFQMCRAR